MKTTKKLLSMLLALIMVVSVAVPVFADETTYTITITNGDAISSAGHVYHAYQIFDGTLDNSEEIMTDISWGLNINAEEFLAALKNDTTFGAGDANIFKGAETAADVATILATPKNHTSDIINAFAKHATNNLNDALPVDSSTEDNAPYTISIPEDLAGYYLVVDDVSVLEDKENKDVSDFILQVVADVEVEHKGSIPTMDKTVSETGETYGDAIATGISDVHYYRLIAELPDDYNLYDTYYLEFQDEMSQGLTFEEIVAVKAIVRSGSTTVDIDGYVLNVTPNEAKTTDMSLVIENLKAEAALSSDDAVEVIYKVSLNEDAVINGDGIVNTAKIVYSNNPNSSTDKGESNSDETNVYPIKLLVKKVDGKDTAVPLDGAQFILSRKHSDGTQTHMEYAEVKNGRLVKWLHHYAGDECAVADADHATAVEENKLGTILTTVGGEIAVEGLDAGKFYLTEIAAPNGYNKILEDIEISVSIQIDEENDKISSMTGTINTDATFNPDDAEVIVTIKNFKGDVLPSTGGIGTTLFYVIGGAMVAFAALTLITKKRMNKE